MVKQNKKNIEVLCGIGRAYLDIKDTENARLYAEMAMKTKGGAQSALPHILLGDIYAVNDDGGSAAMEYEQAILFDKMNPEPYRKYAQINSKVSPEASAAKSEELRKVRPDYPVDVINATIYMRANNLAKAVEYYDKVNKASMESGDLVNYSLCEFLTNNFEKSRDIALFGAEKFPRHPGLDLRGDVEGAAQMRIFACQRIREHAAESGVVQDDPRRIPEFDLADDLLLQLQPRDVAVIAAGDNVPDGLPLMIAAVILEKDVADRQHGRVAAVGEAVLFPAAGGHLIGAGDIDQKNITAVGFRLLQR